ncbi:MAG: peptide chain release factor N(5)-glutamine methyltransferase [Ruminococcus sp.]|jgi:release factor glutamine methyltransferase|nr:peptide chain release factor N(5)-glutamine methyltransferase [Ruminococcus sp.]
MKYSELLPFIENRLKGGGIDAKDSAFEAVQIAKHVAGLSLEAIKTYPDSEIPEGWLQSVNKIVSERAFKRKPLQYLLGEWEFYGNRMRVGEGVLIPRPETELLINITRNYFETNEIYSPSLIDLCTGSGCIAITLKKLFPSADIRAIDISTQVFPFISFNEKLNNVTILSTRGDVTKESALQNYKDEYGNLLKFDVIVCNPPYLTKGELNLAQPELKFEPEIALNGGLDGLDFYRLIPIVWKNALRPGGMMLFEIGETQASEVNKILRRAGFENIKIFNDTAGNKRAIAGFMPMV